MIISQMPFAALGILFILNIVIGCVFGFVDSPKLVKMGELTFQFGIALIAVATTTAIAVVSIFGSYLGAENIGFEQLVQRLDESSSLEFFNMLYSYADIGEDFFIGGLMILILGAVFSVLATPGKSK